MRGLGLVHEQRRFSLGEGMPCGGTKGDKTAELFRDRFATPTRRLRSAGAKHLARGVTIMSELAAVVKMGYQCPFCGNALPRFAALPPFDAPCCECGSRLWCRQRASVEGVMLEAVAGRAPESGEVERLVDALERHGAPDRVFVDLSQLSVINSSFLAALVGMKKRLQPFGCTLYLCGLRPLVREIFERLRLDTLFHLVRREEDVAMLARRFSTTAAIVARGCGRYNEHVSPAPVL